MWSKRIGSLPAARVSEEANNAEEEDEEEVAEEEATLSLPTAIILRTKAARSAAT